MPEWETEQLDYTGHTRVIALVLDDGTRLRNYRTELENEYGETETFEVIKDRDMYWYEWGPHDLAVILTRTSIQSLYDAGKLTVIEE